MRWWDEQVVPRLVDVALRGSEVGERRAEVCAGLAGRVLEVGFGSGLNLPFYPPEVTEVLAVEPSDVGWALAKQRIDASAVPVRRVGLDGAALSLPDASVDGVVSTFSLCTIPDVEAALAEMRRVLRPDGAFHFADHGLSPDAPVQRWQRRLDGVHSRTVGGCHITRPITTLLEGAGFEVTQARTLYAGRPKSTSYLTIGRAVPV